MALALLPADRAALHAAIAERFDRMLVEGLVDELRALRQRWALVPAMPSMRCVGYRQAWQFLDGAIDARRLRETGVAATRQLARRQLTWLRATPAVPIDLLRPNALSAARAAIRAAVGSAIAPQHESG